MLTNTRGGLQISLKGGEELERQLLNIKANDIPRVTSGAIRYAANAAPAAVSKQMRQHYHLAATRVKKDVVVGRVGALALNARIKLNRRPVTAMQFGAKAIGGRRPQRGKGRGKGRETLPASKRQGLTWKIMRGQPRSFTPYGFIGRAKQGGQIPFLRTKGGALKTIYGPSIHASFTSGAKADTMKDEVGKVLLSRLETGVGRAIRRFGR